MKEIFKEMNAIVKSEWRVKNLGTWITFFVGVIISSIGEWWYTLSERTISDFLDACTFTIPGDLFVAITTFALINEYYARKEDEEV